MYLVAVLDWYSRYIVAWELDQRLELPFVLRAARRALAGAAPAIWNSDQGSHFTSPPYLGLLEGAAVRISMDGKGRALDNIFTERLWRTVKYEEVYLHSYTPPQGGPPGADPLPGLLQPQPAAPGPRLPHPGRGLPRPAPRTPRRGGKRTSTRRRRSRFDQHTGRRSIHLRLAHVRALTKGSTLVGGRMRLRHYRYTRPADGCRILSS